MGVVEGGADRTGVSYSPFLKMHQDTLQSFSEKVRSNTYSWPQLITIRILNFLLYFVRLSMLLFLFFPCFIVNIFWFKCMTTL